MPHTPFWLAILLILLVAALLFLGARRHTKVADEQERENSFLIWSGIILFALVWFAVSVQLPRWWNVILLLLGVAIMVASIIGGAGGLGGQGERRR